MEGLPVVLIEAMALGRPVLASRVAGIPELVEEGQAGYLFTPSDWDDLARRLGALLDARARWPQMGRAGRDRVEAEFRSDHAAARMARLFRDDPD
jgi:glycosyltransferase involved in cell wall biosynthesis